MLNAYMILPIFYLSVWKAKLCVHLVALFFLKGKGTCPLQKKIRHFVSLNKHCPSASFYRQTQM